MTELNRAVEKHPDNPVVKALAARLLGNGGDLSGQGNLTPLAVNTLPENALILGHEANSPDKLLGFAGEGSLITVAPPGSGKTQCHVLPNLLTWNGPAVVLDIKGEIHAATSAWRAANVGPIFKFSPLDPDQGHSYNPLLAVSDEPDHIWEDSRFLADMLIVPSGKSKDPFWESRARDVLNAAIAITVRNNSPEERTMAPVLDILHGVGWDRFIISLQAATDVPTMARMGRSLGEMEPKTRDGVLQSALASMSAWEGARIARATQKSDWTPPI
ncbi:type IV secretory system conjugative DNA transfer family protein [Hankyongella ginsenosidimutans]|uniref:type IV secretory system conjugative DNA transfer family protein n=1 Tax=Hankyongella ginsenosidimutans TaxID=1763828 RepID=UPI001CA312E8|nr:type IV secretory system conjugative DNA transfer family protein [Hankyongella ginsenosidimutans]